MTEANRAALLQPAQILPTCPVAFHRGRSWCHRLRGQLREASLCHKVPAEVRKKQLRAACVSLVCVLQQKAVPRADLTSVWLAPHMRGLCRGFAVPTRLAEYSACECEGVCSVAALVDSPFASCRALYAPDAVLGKAMRGGCQAWLGAGCQHVTCRGALLRPRRAGRAAAPRRPRERSILAEQEHQLRGRSVCQVRGPGKQLAAPLCMPGTTLRLVWKAQVLPRSHLGPAPLAAASLATSLANVTGYSVMAGLAGATSTLCGQACPWALWPSRSMWQCGTHVCNLCTSAAGLNALRNLTVCIL